MSAPLNTGKSLSAPSTTPHSPAPPQLIPSASFDSGRRPNQSGGGGSSSNPSFSAPRKSQAARKQHRNQRRAAGPVTSLDEDDAMAELRAVRNASSRRGQTSITHLLNYSLPPRLTYENHHYAHARSYRRNPTWGPGSGHHAVDKARYVHANYRFVVSPTGSYSTQAVDADEHLDWSDVLQVIASAESQQASCPICLSEPVAPRMAKCGHIFCLSCLIRFMHSSANDDDERKQNRWRKCPICEDSVFVSDVRPVRFYAGQESPLPRPGDDVVLRLMTRTAHSTLALPKESGGDPLNAGEDVPWHFAANVLDYARIMKGTGDYMVEQFDREIEDLLKTEKEDELLFHEDNEWTQRAIKAINASKEKMAGLGITVEQLTSKPATAPSSSLAPGFASEQDFFFYTSPPHLYLSPLDIRILKTKYGSFSAFPSTLLPRVEHISTGHAVDDAMRKRAKYLGHIPRGCLISFLECDWTDIVPADILDTFADEIERRRRRNRDKAAQEERERLQAERLEAAALRGPTRRNMGAAGDDDVIIRFSAAAAEAERPVVDPNDFRPLGEATTPPNPRPGFAQLANLSTSPSAHRTVWGTPAIATSPEIVPVQHVAVDDGWLRDDEFLETLGAAEMAVQMEALGIAESSASAEKGFEGGGLGGVESPIPTVTGGGGGGGGGKKKKKQKITLMSTGGRRGN